MSLKILVVGSSNIDFVLSEGITPRMGETVVIDGTYTYVPGGKGANAAVTVSRLGGESYLCTKLGDDAYGDRLLQLYREDGVRVKYVTVDSERKTGLAVVFVEENGNNRIIVYPGANNALKERDIEEAFDCEPNAVLLNLEIPFAAVKATVDYARERRIPVFMDCGGLRNDFIPEEISELEIISPNEVEAERLTGIKPVSLNDCLKACIRISNMMKCKYVVLKLGERGSYIYDGTYAEICSPYTVQAVDTTAAGDAFTAALALEYLNNGRNITEACRYANAAGAITVTRPGAMTSLPKDEDVRLFMRTHSQI